MPVLLYSVRRFVDMLWRWFVRDRRSTYDARIREAASALYRALYGTDTPPCYRFEPDLQRAVLPPRNDEVRNPIHPNVRIRHLSQICPPTSDAADAAHPTAVFMQPPRSQSVYVMPHNNKYRPKTPGPAAPHTPGPSHSPELLLKNEHTYPSTETVEEEPSETTYKIDVADGMKFRIRAHTTMRSRSRSQPLLAAEENNNTGKGEHGDQTGTTNNTQNGTVSSPASMSASNNSVKNDSMISDSLITTTTRTPSTNTTNNNYTSNSNNNVACTSNNSITTSSAAPQQTQEQKPVPSKPRLLRINLSSSSRPSQSSSSSSSAPSAQRNPSVPQYTPSAERTS